MVTHSNEDALSKLTQVISRGLPGPDGGVKPYLQQLFGSRYQKRHFDPGMLRDAYALAGEEGDAGVPYAGIINPDNPPSGPYGGTSIVWFPTGDVGSLIGFGVGTRGLSPDEGILTRHGHRRRTVALRRHLARLGIEAWTKADPAAIDTPVPKVVRDRFRGYEKVFNRYGREMYCNAIVPGDDHDLARTVVQAFFDLYAYERGWQVLKSFEDEYNRFIGSLSDALFQSPSANDINILLRRRRFVIIQGPPGTGKTRLAEEVLRHHFNGHGMTVQFHPTVSYEDFLIGLAPETQSKELRFDVRPGWLLEAARQSQDRAFVLVIDEVNRGDLGKILGEAIYLFEAGEVGGVNARRVNLPHPFDGERTFEMPANLYVLATMNTADRSIASIDLAIRRRFAFVTQPPVRQVVAETKLPLGLDIFDRLVNVFVEYAPEEALDLIPGHAYFLARDAGELRERFRYELLPLVDEYLRLGLLGPASGELHAVRDAIEDAVHGVAN